MSAGADFTFGLEPVLHPNLMPHQREAVIRACDAEQYGIFHEMGAGKTITGIALAKSALHNGARQVLVVCPPSLAINWEREFAKWEPTLTTVRIHTRRPADKPEGMFTTLPEADVIIATDGALAGWLNWFIGGEREFTWDDTSKPKYDEWGNTVPYEWFTRDFGAGVDAIIVDECQRVANSLRSARARAFQRLGDERPTMPKWVMSGTPMQKHRLQLSLLMDSLAGSYKAHTVAGGVECAGRKEWLTHFAPAVDSYGRRGTANTLQLHDEMFHPVYGWAHRVRTGDVVTLPEFGRTVVAMPMGSDKPADAEVRKAQAKYHEALRDLEAYLIREYGRDKAERRLKAEALTKMQELRRLVSRAKVRSVCDAVDILVEGNASLIAEGEKPEQVLIICNENWEREFIAEHFRKTLVRKGADGRKRDDVVMQIHGSMSVEAKMRTVDAWQEGTVEVCVANVISASTGFTMTSGRHVVFATIPWNASDLMQAEARLLRYGAERTVVSTVVVAVEDDGRDTWDSLLWGIVSGKYAEQRGVLDGHEGALVVEAEDKSVAEAMLEAMLRRLGLLED